MSKLRILRYLPHYLRKKFDQKIIVIESDDWGLERGLENSSIEFLRKKFGDGKFSRWTLDALETKEDLQMLFELIESYKNKSLHPPVITANFITHNVDYSSDKELKFIPLSKGFNRSTEDVRSIYKTGIEKRIIYPQLHGYSHYNLSELNKYFYTEEAKEFYANGFLTGRSTIKGNMKFLQGEMSDENMDLKIEESCDEFYRMFGFKPDTVIPPTYILDKQALEKLRQCGITMLQSSNRLLSSDGRRYNIPYYRKRKGFVWSVRNARLDPHEDYGFNSDQCIADIGKAFNNRLPAIIDFHRVNISGRYAPAYRDKTLSELKKLFDKIYSQWSDVKFLNSSELNKIIWQPETR
ncbi:MAG TPA: hypothetical protein PK536_03815 [Ignavibacteria bacterium]|nr:hypothetical protein [Ignavibacteria bacterium]HRJ98520.1 hypothetical protein [Ignavibacteria bacterium]